VTERDRPPGHFRTGAAFRARWREIDRSLDLSDDLRGAEGPLGQDGVVLGKKVSNRWCVHPMEGWDGEPDGRPSPHTLRRWRHFGKSGAALIWGGEAFAVEGAGRANPHQLYLNDAIDAASSLAQLRAAIDAGRRQSGVIDDPCVVGLQLTHSGRFSSPTADRSTPLPAFHHPLLDRRGLDGSSGHVLTDGELEGVAERFVKAAQLAAETGFDFVDVKCCHGYLLHELLGAHTRDGPYGGSFENRTRLFRRIVEDIRASCPGLGIGCRVSIVDIVPFAAAPDGRGRPEPFADLLPYRHGFGVDPMDPVRPDFDEAGRFLDLLRALGISAVNLTVGSPYYNPHIQRPAAYPPSDGYRPPEDPLHGVAFQIQAVRRCKAAAPDLTMIGSGYTYLQEWLPHVAEFEVGNGNVDFVGLGRMILSYPELPLDALAGRPFDRKKWCRTFSDCTTGPRNGLVSGCFPLDAYYRALPEAARLRELKGEMRGHEGTDEDQS